MNSIMSWKITASTTQSLHNNQNHAPLGDIASVQEAKTLLTISHKSSTPPRTTNRTTNNYRVSPAFIFNKGELCPTLIIGVEEIWKGHQDLLKCEGERERENT